MRYAGGMAQHTQLIDAVNIRVATRAFAPAPIDDDTIRQLSTTMDAVNMLAGTHLQLVTGQPAVFAAANASGHLTNAEHYIAVAGPANDDQARERAGFYAERVVLTATLRGLGTLWVAGSWDRDEAARHCRLKAGEELYLGIVIGQMQDHAAHLAKSYDELVAEQRSHRPSKTVEQCTPAMSEDERAAAPDWFRSGVEAALKAPSAMNRQPVLFVYHADDGTASAHIDPDAGDEHWALNDLGIAKMHFQIGAGQGDWEWGDGGRFRHR